MFCSKCGNQVQEESKFCPSCGAILGETQNGEKETAATPQMDQTESPLSSTTPKKKKKLWIALGAILAAVVLIAGVGINLAVANSCEKNIEKAYNMIVAAQERAERYCVFEEKVWRNCIMQVSSSETDKYTKNSYTFYSDFNNALVKFYEGESDEYLGIESEADVIDNIMSKLKRHPSKFDTEYKAIFAMYVAYSQMADLVLGDSSYSLNSFSEASESAKAEFKTAQNTAKVLII